MIRKLHKCVLEEHFIFLASAKTIERVTLRYVIVVKYLRYIVILICYKYIIARKCVRLTFRRMETLIVYCAQ